MPLISDADLSVAFEDLDGRLADFTPPAGSPTVCTILLQEPQEISHVGFAGSRDANRQIFVRRAEVADPKGGLFSSIEDYPGTFRVTGAELDNDGQIWVCNVNSVT